jgi:hypothetical protein
MPLRWEKGFRRITLLVSAALLVIGLVWSALYGLKEKPGWAMYLGGVALALVISAIPWAIFFISRWIVRGFQGGAS